MSGKRSAARRALAVAAALALLWVAAERWAPGSVDIRSFDAGEVARLEAAMWRSYYDRDRLRLFVQLRELLRAQYHLPPLSSFLAAGHASRAAFAFKQGANRQDYERALPDLARFYAAINRVSRVPFDAGEAARLELAWWVAHRERAEQVPQELAAPPPQEITEPVPQELVRAAGALAAEIFQVPVEELQEHARLRVEAMMIRDRRAAAGEVTAEDWIRIQELLRVSWRSLSMAVKRRPESTPHGVPVAGTATSPAPGREEESRRLAGVDFSISA